MTRAWAERSEALGKIDFIADAHGRLAEAMGLAKDFGEPLLFKGNDFTETDIRSAT